MKVLTSPSTFGKHNALSAKQSYVFIQPTEGSDKNNRQQIHNKSKNKVVSAPSISSASLNILTEPNCVW